MENNSGRYSKFQERLKRIVRFKFNRKRKNKGKTDEVVMPTYRKKDVLRENRNVNLIKDISVNKDNNLVNGIRAKRNVNVKKTYTVKKVNKSKEFKDSLKKQVDMVVLEKEKKKVKENNRVDKIINNSHLTSDNNDVNKKDVHNDLDVLGVILINKIKSSFQDKLDELNVIESELYLVGVDIDDALEMKKIIEIKKKIKKIIDEINSIIEEYNLYNKNYYMESFVGIEDRFLEADIVNYRRLLDSSDNEKAFVREYKLLDEFKSLYNKLSNIKNDTMNLMDSNEEKRKNFDIRDKKYKRIVDGVLKITNVEMECLGKIKEQNKYLKELSSKLTVIDKEEYVTMHLRGMGELISQSLRYVGLRMLSPLSGLIPSIAVNTLMTRQLIGNIRNNLRYEKVKHVYYKAYDYDRELSDRIIDVDYTEDLILDTLDDIKKLKEDFLMQYDSKISGYEDTLKKINEVEEIIYRNQNSISKIKKRLIQNKKINQNKLVKVKKLNENS